MKIGFLFAGIVVIGLQLMAESLGDLIVGVQFSLIIIGMMLIVDGIAVEPRFDRIEEKIWDMKEEILELKYPLKSDNED